MSLDGFSRASGELCCDGVSVASLAQRFGTPLYVYSGAVIRRQFTDLHSAFGAYPHSIHYALKANSSLGLIRVLRELGSGVDANSVWEIEAALRCGVAPQDIVFTGVGKAPHEIAHAVSLRLKAINVESRGELLRVEQVASSLGVVARVALRLNPDIDAKSHPHISTGLKVNKFGIALDEARGLVESLRSRPHVSLVAVHVHIGSQITDVGPVARAAEFAAQFARECSASGVALEYVDVGGGLGIAYDDRPALTAQQYVGALVAGVGPTGLPIVIEPGRAIVGPAGVLLGSVVDIKPRTATSEFVVLDAGMTELLRPALYGAFHRIEPASARRLPLREYEIVGPVCESSDVVGRDRRLPEVTVGDVLVIRDAGAYGAAMASNYNRRPLPPEVLVDRGEARLIRRRQTLDDMVALESP